MSKKHKKPAAKKASRKPTAKKKTPKVARISLRSWKPIKKKLLTMREDLLEMVQKKQNTTIESPDVGDEADQASNSLEKEMLFELNDNERTMLDQIEGTLRKMEKGVYGLCESCQQPIQRARLDAVPFARYCIACQNTNETANV